MAVKRYKLALEAFQRTVQTLDDSNLPMDKKQKWQKDIQIMITVLLKECGSIEKKNGTELGKLACFLYMYRKEENKSTKFKFGNLRASRIQAIFNFPSVRFIYRSGKLAVIKLKKLDES